MRNNGTNKRIYREREEKILDDLNNFKRFSYHNLKNYEYHF